MNGHISKYFTWEEATHSQTAARLGIDNTPDAEQQETIKATARAADLFREYIGKPVIVSSWFRSPKLNAAVKGAKESAHLTGSAIDLVCPAFGTPAEVIQALKDSGIPFQKAIVEFPKSGGWAHIDFGGTQRIVLVTDDGKHYRSANA